MRASWLVSLLVSIIGHIGAILMTTLAWQTASMIVPIAGSVVPVEIVDIAPESNVRALAEEAPDEELAPEPMEEAAEAEAAPTPAAATRDRRPPRDAGLDLDAAARMLNTDTKTGRERREGERAERSQRGAGLGTAQTAALEDLNRSIMQRHIMRCWRMPIDLPDPERLVVTLEFDLDRNGNLRGQPRVTSPRNYSFDPPMRVAVEAAVRAVRACDPYPFPNDHRISEHYEIWDDQEFTFRPPQN